MCGQTADAETERVAHWEWGVWAFFQNLCNINSIHPLCVCVCVCARARGCTCVWQCVFVDMLWFPPLFCLPLSLLLSLLWLTLVFLGETGRHEERVMWGIICDIHIVTHPTVRCTHLRICLVHTWLGPLGLDISAGPIKAEWFYFEVFFRSEWATCPGIQVDGVGWEWGRGGCRGAGVWNVKWTCSTSLQKNKEKAIGACTYTVCVLCLCVCVCVHTCRVCLCYTCVCVCVFTERMYQYVCVCVCLCVHVCAYS